jgi:probable phosphoglycerate mutase
MSDLQCPATFLVVGWAPAPCEHGDVERVRGEGRGRLGEPAGLADLADELRDRRIAVVCSGRDATALGAASLLAGRLGVPHRGIDGLQPPPAGPARAGAAGADAQGGVAKGAGAPGVGAEGADAPSARHRAALDALADLHRGETVVVVMDISVLTALWPGTRTRDAVGAPSPYRLVTVQVDGDGWRLLGRPGGG